MMTLIGDFLDTHASKIWGPKRDQTPKHLTESISKVEIFLSYDGNHLKHFSDIKARDIIDFGHWLRDERGVSENTLNHYKAAISAIFTYAIDYEEISEDQMPRIKFKKVQTSDPVYYTPAQIKLIQDYLAGCKNKWLLHMFNIGLLTGMRRGEIWSVTRKNITWIDGEMFIHLPHTKNGFSRDVPVSVATKREFDAVDWAFPKTRGKGLFPEGAHRDAWKEIRRVICDNKKMSVFHATRHTAASILTNEMGTSLALVADMLGHKDLATTKKYVHVAPQTLTGLANGLANRSL
jgi:integrase|tara:strand:+ start:118 stop:993 length:876 start_codon:yes stop_codon:yes gene_type:complete